MLNGLTEILPPTETFQVGAGSVAVRGISLRGVASLVSRFAALRDLFSGKGVDAQTVFETAPDAVSAIIAAGCGYLDNKEAENIFDALPIETQLNLMEAVFRLTFPGGFGPFVERIQSLASSLSDDAGKVVGALATKSPSPQSQSN